MNFHLNVDLQHSTFNGRIPDIVRLKKLTLHFYILVNTFFTLFAQNNGESKNWNFF